MLRLVIFTLYFSQILLFFRMNLLKYPLLLKYFYYIEGFFGKFTLTITKKRMYKSLAIAFL